MGVSTLIIGAIIKFIPLKYFQWTEYINLEDDIDDNKVLQMQSLFNEKMGTLQNDYMSRMQTQDEGELSVDDGSDEDANGPAINGQDEEDSSSDNEEDASQNNSRGNSHRSSNVMRYSMRLTQMYDKKKKTKK